MYGYIYETTCVPTGKKYIGMHKWSGNDIDPNYLGSGIYLQRAIKKYGKKNFTCNILEWCETRDELCEKEKQYISQVQAPINEDYLNINDGGFGGHDEFYVQPITENQLKSLERGRHLPASEELKRKLSEYRKSVIVSDETKDKLRKNQLGRKVINDGRINKYVFESELDEYLLSGWKLGQKPKDRTEQINKFKQTHENKDKTVWKQNISNAIKGRRWVTNDIIDKQVLSDEVESYLLQGFRLGRCKARG